MGDVLRLPTGNPSTVRRLCLAFRTCGSARKRQNIVQVFHPATECGEYSSHGACVLAAFRVPQHGAPESIGLLILGGQLMCLPSGTPAERDSAFGAFSRRLLTAWGRLGRGVFPPGTFVLIG